MAYTVPHRFAHLEAPSAANLNALKANLEAIDTSIEDRGRNYAVGVNRTTTHGFFFVHIHRWLHISGSYEILDPSGVGENITGGVDGELAVVDLDGIEWMSPGKIYAVKDALFAAEDYDA